MVISSINLKQSKKPKQNPKQVTTYDNNMQQRTTTKQKKIKRKVKSNSQQSQ
jgi:hypothetical protein